jgi:Lon protease-like protein
MIGVVLLRPGWQQAYEGRPAVYPIGCSGVITHFEKLTDGRYNIVLRGLDRFRIVDEDHTRSYRRGIIEPLHEGDLTAADRDVLRRHRIKLEGLLTPVVEGSGGDPRTASVMTDEDLVNALAQYLDLEALEKQALLERNCLRSRAESLVELLEMKMMAARTPGLSNVAH